MKLLVLSPFLIILIFQSFICSTMEDLLALIFRHLSLNCFSLNRAAAGKGKGQLLLCACFSNLGFFRVANFSHEWLIFFGQGDFYIKKNCKSNKCMVGTIVIFKLRFIKTNNSNQIYIFGELEYCLLICAFCPMYGLFKTKP